MLKSLKIENGSISPKFNPDVFEYEVKVDNTVFSLDLDYIVDDDNDITVYGNDYLTDGEGHVLIEVYDKKEVITYTLNVYKSKSVIANKNNKKEKVEVPIKNQIFEDIKAPLIASICFIVIIIIFCILFGKRKKHR